MNPTPSYYCVFFDINKNPIGWKKVEHTFFAAYAQDEVLTEIEIGGTAHIITSRKSFNMSYSYEISYYLIMDIILKPE